jgi:hypothetical protein
VLDPTTHHSPQPLETSIRQTAADEQQPPSQGTVGWPGAPLQRLLVGVHVAPARTVDVPDEPPGATVVPGGFVGETDPPLQAMPFTLRVRTAQAPGLDEEMPIVTGLLLYT